MTARPTRGVVYQDTIGSPARSDKTINRVLSQSTRVHILRDKLEEQQAEDLERLASSLGAQLTSNPQPANIIVTALKAPKRIAKHVGDEHVITSTSNTSEQRNDTAGKASRENTQDVGMELGMELGKGEKWAKFVVTPAWLHAVQAQGTLVDPDEFLATPTAVPPATASSFDSDRATAQKRKRDSESPTPEASLKVKRVAASDDPGSAGVKSRSSATSHGDRPSDDGNSKDKAGDVSVPRWQNSRYACKRPSPLKCVNQALVDELEVIRNERRLTGDVYSEMAYMRAISALKAFPYRIPLPGDADFDPDMLSTRLSEVEKLKGIGKKVFSLIRQFCTPPTKADAAPHIIEAKVIRRDRAVFVMNAFTELYGIGPIGAREAYNSGARSFTDVLSRGKSLATHLTARESLRILPDLRKPIPRQECREITELMIRLLRDVLPKGARLEYEICGGYRRGKQLTYDLDVIIGHGERASRALHQQLLDEMKKKGLVTHIVNISTPASAELDDVLPTPAATATATATATAAAGPNVPNDTGNRPIHVDIANIVVLPPITRTNATPVHRRVDLVFAPLRVYGATVLGWTGSMTFERDLRLWAKSKGYNFSFDGLTNLAEECVVDTPTERSIFELLELEWMPPELRNCDA
ncbi:Nucleotidyltransferase [Testicularia cyperi]|uniref:DNA polymerase n=1 Tax=Testicularia cyperi TaxID=1882483 RepID=A0A317XVK0_9BASI|nr:Nucleotidyltransferase [Testicularia cyperi]